MLLASLLLASASAAALDLELTLPGAEPFHVVLTDAQDRRLPGLLVASDDGTTYRVNADVTSPSDGQHEVAFTIDALTVDRKGRQQVTTVARPTVLALTNQAGEFNASNAHGSFSLRFTVRDEG